MTARQPVEFVTLDGQRVGNLVRLDGANNEVHLVDAAGTNIETANPLPVVFYRGTTPATATFTASTNSTFIDKRKYAMVQIGPIPASMNGRDVTILSGSNAAGDGAVVPNYLNSAGAYAALVTLAAVATGAKYVLQADVAAIHYIGFHVSGAAISGSLPVELTA